MIELEDLLIFLFRPALLLYCWVQLIDKSLPYLLSAPVLHHFAYYAPIPTMLFYQLEQLLILLLRPYRPILLLYFFNR
jgi:hypothetical protein